MPPPSIRSFLLGGDRRTLKGVGEVVALVLKRPDRIEELIDCVVDDDEIVRMRASDAIEKLCRADRALVQAHLDRLLREMGRSDQPSVRWHLAQMLGEVELTPSQKRKALAVLRRNLDTASDWIVLNYSLESFARLARRDARLVSDLAEYLRRFEHSPLKSLASRSRRLLHEFG